MRVAVIFAALMLPAAALAQDGKQEAEKPVTTRDPSLGDAITTPAADLNLKKDEIPALLLAAEQRPYDLNGLRRCSDLAGAITQLDSVLGPDIDLPAESRTGLTAGRVAQAAVGSLIPFRGLIRELSGANAQERKIQLAVEAGLARRAYLKGVGEARGCRYPARSAGPAEVAAFSAAQAEPEGRPEPKPAAGKDGKGVSFVSQPVVQPIKK